jgi:hypothetical protein
MTGNDMTVGELISALQSLPADLEVLTEQMGGIFGAADTVDVRKIAGKADFVAIG